MIDLQASAGVTPFGLDAVGITGLKYPVIAWDRASNETQRGVALWKLSVDLAADQRGTHMSRFLEELNEVVTQPFDCDAALALAARIRLRQSAARARIRCRFDWVRTVKAPVSGALGHNTYAITLRAESSARDKKVLELTIPVTSLCPCSKAISERGAHNQRSVFKVSLSLRPDGPAPSINHVIRMLEECGSAPVYPVLKREDEKYLTEWAYDHPAFVEDLARAIAVRLAELPDLVAGTIKVVNMESIHAHDCFAVLRFSPR